MNNDFERQWSALVGDRAVIGAVTTVPWPSEGVGEGKSMSLAALTLASLVASGFTTGSFARLAIRAVDEAGARIDVEPSRPGLIKFVGPTSAPIDLVSGTPVEGFFYRDPEDPGTAYLDANGLGPCVVSQGQVAFAIYCAGTKLSIASVARPDSVAVPAFAEWMRDFPDQWLQREAEVRASRGSLWDVAVAVGLAARLLEPDSPERRRALISDVRTRRVVEALAAPRLWARARSKPELDALERTAGAEAAVIAKAMPALADAVDPDDPVWADAQLVLRHRRDDLEGVRLLLHEATGEDRIGALLEDVDRTGETWSLSLPALDGDERLHRVSRVDPDAWWAQ